MSLGNLAWHSVDRKSPYFRQQRKYLEVLKLLANDVVDLKAHVNGTDLV